MKGIIRKLWGHKDYNNCFLTIPKVLCEFLGWEDKDEIVFYVISRKILRLSKPSKRPCNRKSHYEKYSTTLVRKLQMNNKYVRLLMPKELLQSLRWDLRQKVIITNGGSNTLNVQAITIKDIK